MEVGKTRNQGNTAEVEEEGKVRTLPSAGTPGDIPHTPPGALPIPASPSSSTGQLPPPQYLVQRSPPEYPFGRNREQFLAPVVGRNQSRRITWVQLHERCSQRGYRREETKEVSKTRLAPMDSAEAKRKPVGGEDMDASETANGRPRRGRWTRMFRVNRWERNAASAIFTWPSLRKRG